jgi:hypothetical protein
MSARTENVVINVVIERHFSCSTKHGSPATIATLRQIPNIGDRRWSQRPFRWCNALCRFRSKIGTAQQLEINKVASLHLNQRWLQGGSVGANECRARNMKEGGLTRKRRRRDMEAGKSVEIGDWSIIQWTPPSRGDSSSLGRESTHGIPGFGYYYIYVHWTLLQWCCMISNELCIRWIKVNGKL